MLLLCYTFVSSFSVSGMSTFACITFDHARVNFFCRVLFFFFGFLLSIFLGFVLIESQFLFDFQVTGVVRAKISNVRAEFAFRRRRNAMDFSTVEMALMKLVVVLPPT